MSDDTNTDDSTEREAIDLQVSGDDAVAKAKAMLAGYDIDDADVSRISITVFEHDRGEPQTTDANPGEKTSKTRSKRSKGNLTEDDRSLQGIQEGSSHHLVLALVDALDDGDGVTPDEAVDGLSTGRANSNHLSTVMSKLYKRRLLDRDTGTRPYTYTLTSHGKATLDEHGHDVAPEEVGGVWADA